MYIQYEKRERERKACQLLWSLIHLHKELGVVALDADLLFCMGFFRQGGWSDIDRKASQKERSVVVDLMDFCRWCIYKGMSSSRRRRRCRPIVDFLLFNSRWERGRKRERRRQVQQLVTCYSASWFFCFVFLFFYSLGPVRLCVGSIILFSPFLFLSMISSLRWVFVTSLRSRYTRRPISRASSIYWVWLCLSSPVEIFNER